MPDYDISIRNKGRNIKNQTYVERKSDESAKEIVGKTIMYLIEARKSENPAVSNLLMNGCREEEEEEEEEVLILTNL